jgi:selenocysteine lyase/cysteine desulfurase
MEPKTAGSALAEVRELFELPKGIYLYSHAVGCLPKVAREGPAAYFGEWAAQGGNAWDPWLAEVQRFNAALSKLLKANVADVCPQVNLSSALTKLVQSLPKRARRNRIILSLLDFPTIGFVAKQAERLGYKVEFAGIGSGGIDPRLAAIDECTALVIWTHAYPNTGTAIEPPTRAQLQGAYLCVDIAQSAGVIPIDLTRWDADFVIGSCVKFLCGGAGAGYLWARPGLANELQPTDVGWFSHARPFEFDIESFEYAPDATRFWGGTPSVVPYAIAARSIELIDSIGVPNIRAHNLKLSQLIIDVANSKGLTVVSPQGPKQSATVVLDTGDNWAAKQLLNDAGVHCDARKFGLRLSPHIYNTEEEIAAAVALL